MSEVYDNYYDGFSRKKTLSEKLHIDIPLLGGLAAAAIIVAKKRRDLRGEA